MLLPDQMSSGGGGGGGGGELQDLELALNGLADDLDDM